MTLEELIYEKLASLTPGQRKVAEFILQNKEGFSYATLAKLSKQLSVSETTIIRLSYSLGFDSFSAMQQQLRDEILKMPPKSAPSTLAQSCIASTLQKITAAFTAWTASLDEHLVCEIVETLLNADKILIIGGRSSYCTATWLGERLNLLLGNAFVIRQFYDSRIDLLANITENTVAINISFARYTKSTYQYASLLKKRGAKLISFTDTVSSPFYGISDYVMQVAALKDEMGFSSLVCLYCLFDVLTAKLREKRHAEISERLKMCEIIYSDFDLFYE